MYGSYTMFTNFQIAKTTCKMVVPSPAPKPTIAPSKVAPAYLSQLSSNALKSDQSNPSCISGITSEIYG